MRHPVQNDKIEASQIFKNYRSMNRLSATLSQAWLTIQGSLFPWLAEELGPLTEKQQDLVATLELVRIEAPIPSVRGFPGRPADDRSAIARASVAKAADHLPTTRVLLEEAGGGHCAAEGCAGGGAKTTCPTNGRFRGRLPSSRRHGCRSVCTRR